MTDTYELAEFKLEDGSVILVETISTKRGNRNELLSTNGEPVKRAVTTFKETIDSMKGVAETAINSIKEIVNPPKEVTLELGIKLSGETGAIIAKASAEGNIKVTFKWIGLENRNNT